MEPQPSLCFIIACKVYRTHVSYIPFYISKIKEYYPEALIILVDNNSVYKEFYQQFEGVKNIILLENTSDSKFELGAYKFATYYIHFNNLLYDYYVCTQDTFVLVNKYDFNTLVRDNVKACSVGEHGFEHTYGLHKPVLELLNLYDPDETYPICWCSSWVCDYKSLLEITLILAPIKPKIRYESEQTERYMGKILKLLNNNISYSIDGLPTYDCWKVHITSEEAKQIPHSFIKRVQQKTEKTPEFNNDDDARKYVIEIEQIINQATLQ